MHTKEEREKLMEELEGKMKKEHLAFCREYVLNGKNGEKAYLKVYAGTTEEDSARANASRLIAKDNIKAYIELLKEETKEKYNITLETQLEKTARIMKASEGAREFRTALACVQEESKLVDLYQPEKVEQKTKIEIVSYDS